jgi:D-alanyl-D-alanine carboxypeptidase
MPKIKLPTLKIPETRTIAIVTCVIALGAIFFVSTGTAHVKEQTPVKPAPVFVNPFATTTLDAKGAFVYAPTSKHVMFQSNADVTLPLASVTKVMTAFVASTVLSDEDIITISTDDLLPDGDAGLYPGEQWKFKDLRDVMLVASANDAAEAIRRTVDEKLMARGASTTIGIMNEKAAELGLGSLNFQSVTGLDDLDGAATAFGSARDMALMFTHVIHSRPDIFESTRESSIYRGAINGIASTFKNTNVTINDMPSIIASKTGFTDAAGGNLIAAFDAGLGSPIVIAVLGSDNQETRFTDMLELAEKALRYINGTYYSGL